MKVYIAGPLCSESERKEVEKLSSICEKKGFNTFLPHRDAGLWKEGVSFEEIAKKDLGGFKDCDLVVANLNGFNVGAGTAFEIGYAYSSGIPVIGIKEDRAIQDSIEELSAIIVGAIKIVESISELDVELEKLKIK